ISKRRKMEVLRSVICYRSFGLRQLSPLTIYVSKRQITCNYTDVDRLSRELASSYHYDVISAELTYVPKTTLEMTGSGAEGQLSKCLDELEQLDEVVKVHCNTL